MLKWTLLCTYVRVLWEWWKRIRVKGVFVFDFTDTAKLLSSRAWELCCILDATWYCRDCKIYANVMGAKWHLFWLQRACPVYLWGWASFLVFLTVCFVPFVTLPVQVPFSFFFLSIHQKCKIGCSWPTRLLRCASQTVVPALLWATCQEHSVLGGRGAALPLRVSFLNGCTFPLYRGRNNIPVSPCVAWSLNNRLRDTHSPIQRTRILITCRM